MSQLPAISKEQAILETYFQCLSKFAFDKAKDIVDRECQRGSHQITSSASCLLWTQLLSCLASLAVAEKAYASLLYLTHHLAQKIFGRKGNLKTSYGYIVVELKRIEEEKESSRSVPQSSLDELLCHLSGQLCHFIMARSKVMEFYEQIVMMSHNKAVNYDELVSTMDDIIETHSKGFHHPILSALKSTFSLECDISRQLLSSQLELQRWRFLPSLLHLNDAHSKLAVLFSDHTHKETRRLAFASSSRKPTVPVLYQWLASYKRLQVSKFTLYFYDILSKQAPPSEIKVLAAKVSVDFYNKIVSFHKKSVCSHVLLTFDVTGIEDSYQGTGGYHYPHRQPDRPYGRDCYPAIFCYPADRPDRHWPSIISMLNDKAVDLNLLETVFLYDAKLQWTYFMSRIELRITLVVIFEVKKSERDSFINNFLTDITSQLRCSKLFASLKPGSK